MKSRFKRVSGRRYIDRRTGRFVKYSTVKRSRAARKAARSRKTRRAVRKPIRRVKQVWSVKAIYDSPRGNSHDVMFEFKISTVRDSPLTKRDLGDIADKYISARDEEEGFHGIPFNKIEIGLVDQSETDEAVGTREETFKYAHSIKD